MPITPTKHIWMNGELVPWEDAKIHVLSHSLHYGTGVFEGIRAYETNDGTAVFRLTEHIERLHRSARVYRVPLEWSVAELVKACRTVMRDNELEAGYIRPLVYYGLGAIGLNPTGATSHTAIAAWRWGAYLGEEGVLNGIRVGVSSWRRISPAAFVPVAKGCGQYLNSVMAKMEANSNGYDEALLLNSDGNISEGSGENVFVVRGGVVFTPSIASGILDGITRHTVMTLLSRDGIEVREETLTRGDVFNADEVFFTGTAAEVTPVREIDNRPIGTGRPGPVTRRAQELFQRLVSGGDLELGAWLEYV
jgi:branched-chain amino acid aminotransferase